jgi:hypothetical protein
LVWFACRLAARAAGRGIEASDAVLKLGVLLGVHTLMAAATAAAGSNPDVGLPPRAALTTLLSTESLIFAAFAITVTLALPSESGRSSFFTRGWFGGIVVLILAVIATAAFCALVATLDPTPPNGTNEWVRAVGVAVGICAQPLLAIPITVAAVKTKPAPIKSRGQSGG